MRHRSADGSYGSTPMGSADGEALNPRVFDLAANETDRLDPGARYVRGLLVSVYEGSLSVWLGDQVGGAIPSVPHFHFHLVGYPVCLPLPLGRYVFTVAGGTMEGGKGTITEIG